MFVNGGAPTLDVPDVRVDEHAAGYLATRHLLELGHTRIGLVAGPLRSVPTRAKTAGWQAALEEYGVTPDPGLLAHAEYGASGGADCARRLLGPGRPTAVVCASDLMALGAISEARRLALDVPGDLSVVGFDDIPMAAYATPALTTLAQPIAEMAAVAVDCLVAELEGAAASSIPHSRVFRPRVVVRGSTAAPA
jgi:DNA-binding LacI/PurR family transcriptional regulator